MNWEKTDSVTFGGTGGWRSAPRYWWAVVPISDGSEWSAHRHDLDTGLGRWLGHYNSAEEARSACEEWERLSNITGVLL